jgi:hypothetical protein
MFPRVSTGEPVARGFTVMIGTRYALKLVGALLLFLALAPARVSAVTLDQVVTLSKAGVSEAIILALIDRDKTILTIEPDQLIALKNDGVSETVIVALLKSGRAEGEAAANANAALNASTIMSALSPVPDLVIVGHGPERPNTDHHDGFYSGPPAYGYTLPFSQYLPYSPYSQQSYTSRRADLAVAPSLCIAQAQSGPAPAVTPWRFVTECPQQIQPRQIQSRRRR